MGKKVNCLQIKNIFIVLLSLSTIFCWSKFNINWDNRVSLDTIKDGWETWMIIQYSRSFLINRSSYLDASSRGYYKTMSVDDFLKLKIRNHRLNLYTRVKKAKHAYPKDNRPRKGRDLSSIKYFLKTSDPLSPVIVARLHDDKNNIVHVMLDGNHRLVAAYIKKCPIKVYFIDLVEQK